MNKYCNNGRESSRVVIYTIIIILFTSILSVQAMADDREEFNSNPTPENFNKMSNPTAADLMKVQNPTMDNFNKLNDAEKGNYLRTADYSNPSNRNIAMNHFTNPSRSGDNINQNRDSFRRFLVAEGIDMRGVNGAVSGLRQDGTLIGADAQDSININDFRHGGARSDYAINIDSQGKIHLIQKDGGRDIEISGNIKVGGTGNFEIDGAGSFMTEGQNTYFSDGKNIEIDKNGNIRGTFASFDGVTFTDPSPLTYDRETDTLSLRDASISNIADNAQVNVIGRNIRLPYEANGVPITINDGTLRFNNGMISVPSQTTTTLGNAAINGAPMMTINADQETFIGIGDRFPIRDNVVQLGNQFQAKGSGYTIQFRPSNPYIDAIYRIDQYLSFDMNGGAISYDKATNTISVDEIFTAGSVDIINGRQAIHYSNDEQGQMQYDNMIYSAESGMDLLEVKVNIRSEDLIAFADRDDMSNPIFRVMHKGMTATIHAITHIDALITLDPSLTGKTFAEYSMDKAEKICRFHGYDVNEVYPDGLGKFSERAISLDDFTGRMDNSGSAAESLRGSWSQYDTAVAGTYEEDVRYVISPVNQEYVIDMKHFMKAGSASYGSDLVGDSVELGQFWTAMADGGDIVSGGCPQDYYSNRLGSEFFRKHYNKRSGVPMAQQINDFLRNHPE